MASCKAAEMATRSYSFEIDLACEPNCACSKVTELLSVVTEPLSVAKEVLIDVTDPLIVVTEVLSVVTELVTAVNELVSEVTDVETSFAFANWVKLIPSALTQNPVGIEQPTESACAVPPNAT